MATCAAELLFYRQVAQAVGLKVGTCPVYKSAKPEADELVPTLFSNSTCSGISKYAAKPINWLTEKCKHMEIHLNFFRQYVQAGYFKLAKVDSSKNPADALTKSYTSR